MVDQILFDQVRAFRVPDDDAVAPTQLVQEFVELHALVHHRNHEGFQEAIIRGVAVAAREAARAQTDGPGPS